ncbi:hypothetical protein BGX26_000636, partial [Mortierella sp. AD094]
SAENMSYHIPGFRQTHNWFPKEIYFTATLQQVRAYREKYSKDKNEADLELTEDWLRGAVDMDDFVDEELDEEESGNIAGGEKTDKIEEEEDNGGNANDQDGGSDKSIFEDQIDDLKVTESEDQVEASSPVTPVTGQIKSEDDKKGGESTPSPGNSGDKVLIRNLNQQVGDLKTEVGDLKSQVTDLQKQLAEQVLAQREQSQSQFEELKNLLLQRPV